jgi:hypothetical protein
VKIEDFQVGAIFLYEGYPGESPGLKGLGEVIEIANSEVRMRWLWCPNDDRYAQESDYSIEHIRTWQSYCTLITQQERFALLLKHNFE